MFLGLTLIDLLFLVLKHKSDLRANKTTSRNKINSGNSYSQVQDHRLQNREKCYTRALKC